jgi:hypothetical protein
MPTRDDRLFSRSADAPWSRLRALLVEDWGLKLLALAITLVLWFMVSGRIAEREIAIEPRPEGRPAPAFEVKDVVVTPARIKVQGPINRLNEIEKIVVPISVEGRRESFDVSPSSLPLDRNLQPMGRINVHVTIVAGGNAPLKSTSTN